MRLNIQIVRIIFSYIRPYKLFYSYETEQYFIQMRNFLVLKAKIKIKYLTVFHRNEKIHGRDVFKFHEKF